MIICDFMLIMTLVFAGLIFKIAFLICFVFWLEFRFELVLLVIVVVVWLEFRFWLDFAGCYCCCWLKFRF